MDSANNVITLDESPGFEENTAGDQLAESGDDSSSKEKPKSIPKRLLLAAISPFLFLWRHKILSFLLLAGTAIYLNFFALTALYLEYRLSSTLAESKFHTALGSSTELIQHYQSRIDELSRTYAYKHRQEIDSLKDKLTHALGIKGGIFLSLDDSPAAVEHYQENSTAPFASEYLAAHYLAHDQLGNAKYYANKITGEFGDRLRDSIDTLTQIPATEESLAQAARDFDYYSSQIPDIEDELNEAQATLNRMPDSPVLEALKPTWVDFIPFLGQANKAKKIAKGASVAAKTMKARSGVKALKTRKATTIAMAERSRTKISSLKQKLAALRLKQRAALVVKKKAIEEVGNRVYEQLLKPAMSAYAF